MQLFPRKRMLYRDFLNAIPSIHTWDGGLTWNTGGFSRQHLEPLGDLFSSLPRDSVFLETGAGCSTIAMLLSDRGRVISIAPDDKLFGRIIEFCKSNGISTSKLDARISPSEWELPKIASKKKPFVDFVLIDGSHSWPNTFVDLFYANAVLKEGGYLMIDDVQLHSVKEMDRFLSEQPGFLMCLDMGKSHIYKKTGDSRSFGKWNQQPYILRKSQEYEKWDDPFSK